MARSLAPFEVSTGAEPATAALGDQLSIRLKVLNPVHCKLTAQLSSAQLLALPASSGPRWFSPPVLTAMAGICWCADKQTTGGNIPTPDCTSAACHLLRQGLVSGADHKGKKSVLILFINERLVDCAPLKRALDNTYAATYPKTYSPFLFLVRLRPNVLA